MAGRSSWLSLAGFGAAVPIEESRRHNSREWAVPQLVGANLQAAACFRDAGRFELREERIPKKDFDGRGGFRLVVRHIAPGKRSDRCNPG
jgi:hypothetical protein